jgi:hypothetical protein
MEEGGLYLQEEQEELKFENLQLETREGVQTNEAKSRRRRASTN